MDARKSLSLKIEECLKELHDARFVHGDVRNTNILVERERGLDEPFLLLDYDFSGEIGKVQYPLDLNVTTVNRPDGATYGGLIEVEHDLKMLDYIRTV